MISRIIFLAMLLVVNASCVSNKFWNDVHDLESKLFSRLNRCNEMHYLTRMNQIETLAPNIILLRIEAFDLRMNELTEILQSKIDPRSTLIIDLRECPGGNIPPTVHLLDQFIPAGKTLFHLKNANIALYENEFTDVDIFSDGGLILGDVHLATVRNKIGCKIIILTSHATASAAEVFAFVMKYYHRAITIGEKTMGKNWGKIYSEYWVFAGLFYATHELPVYYDVYLDGETYQGGVSPDVRCKSSEALKRALKFIETARTLSKKEDKK